MEVRHAGTLHYGRLRTPARKHGVGCSRAQDIEPGPARTVRGTGQKKSIQLDFFLAEKAGLREKAGAPVGNTNASTTVDRDNVRNYGNCSEGTKDNASYAG